MSTLLKYKTQTEFIEQAIKIHGDKYNYDNFIYINKSTKGIIYCKTCNKEFLQAPQDHIHGQGCRKCASIMRGNKRRKTKESFENEAIKTHGDKYNYDNFIYIDTNTKGIIHCQKCNEDFLQTPDCHLRGQGCRKCGILRRSTERKYTKEMFENKARLIHGNKYNYEKFIFVDLNTESIIYCNICGRDFSQKASTHLIGCGCTYCGYKINAEKRKKTKETFEIDARHIHGDKYNYNNFIYVNSKTKGEIFCKTCKKIFDQTPNCHLRGNGCPKCRMSHMERNMFNILNLINNDLINQKIWKIINIQSNEKTLGNIKLRPDFFITIKLGDGTTKFIVIEMDGIFHFEIVEIGHNSKQIFEETKQRDIAKNNYCLKNNISVLRIDHTIDVGEYLQIVTSFFDYVSKNTNQPIIREVGSCYAKII